MTHKHWLGIKHTFHITIDKQHYVQVFIWDSKKHLNEAVGTPHANLNAYIACARSAAIKFNSRTGMVKIPHKFGELHFVEGGYTAGTVAHEIQHIMIYLMEAKSWMFERYEEKICWMCGSLHEQFWEHHRKLYGEADSEVTE